MNRRQFLPVAAAVFLPMSVRAIEELLPTDQAFKAALVNLKGKTVTFKFLAAPGYYLYSERFTFEAIDSNAKVTSVSLPPGATKFEPAFGRDVVYHRGLVTTAITFDQMALPLKVRVGMQGCADAGVCYPPTSRVFLVDRGNG